MLFKFFTENADDDSDLRIAIELSLQDSYPSSPNMQTHSLNTESLLADTEVKEPLKAIADAENALHISEEADTFNMAQTSNIHDVPSAESIPTLAFSDFDSRNTETTMLDRAPQGNNLTDTTNESKEIPDTLVLPQVKLESLFLKDLEDKQLDYSNNLRTKSPKEDLKTSKQLFKFDQSLDQTSESILRDINRKIITDVSKEEAEISTSTELDDRHVVTNLNSQDLTKFPRTQTAPCSLEAGNVGDNETAAWKSCNPVVKGIAISHNNLIEHREEQEGAVGGVPLEFAVRDCQAVAEMPEDGSDELSSVGSCYTPRRQASNDSQLSCSPDMSPATSSIALVHESRIIHGVTGFDVRQLGHAEPEMVAMHGSTGALSQAAGISARSFTASPCGFGIRALSGQSGVGIRGPSASYSMNSVNIGSPLGFRPLVSSSSSIGNIQGVVPGSLSEITGGDFQFPDEIPVTEKFRAIQAMPKIEKKSRAESPLGALFRRSSSRKKNKNPENFLKSQCESPQSSEFNNRASGGSGNTTPADGRSPMVIWMKRQNKERERAQIEKRMLERSHSEEGTASCRLNSFHNFYKKY